MGKKIKQHSRNKCVKHLNSLNFIIWNSRVKMKIATQCELPALTPDAPAFFNPFFLTMKLAPMKKLEDSARINPFILSDDIPRYESDMASAAACSDAIFTITQQLMQSREIPTTSPLENTNKSLP